jgi:Uma2 family endonuclease
MIASVRPQTRLWTRDEYHRAADLGLFGPEERLELLEGEIIRKVCPQSMPHASAIVLTAEILRDVFGSGYHIREEKPIVLTDLSEPEPDIFVVCGTARQSPGHPTPATAALVIEVSETTLAFDRAEKADAYARSGIANYWILNLRGRCLEVRRDPGPTGEGEYGYRLLQIIAADGTVAPLAQPESGIAVAEMLPAMNV